MPLHLAERDHELVLTEWQRVSPARADARHSNSCGSHVLVIAPAPTVPLLRHQLPAMWTVITKTKSVEHLSVLPTVGQFSNFIAWVMYGIIKSEMQILQVRARPSLALIPWRC